MNKFFSKFYTNHVLANLLFVLILLIGTKVYLDLPREQDPNINFNWINISTAMPGTSAEDVEKLITEPLENAIAKVADIKFVSSNSREGSSSILIRFENIPVKQFDKRIADLRREIQNKEDELPNEATQPKVLEITTANAFPSATIVLTGSSDSEKLRKYGKQIQEDLERIKGVDNAKVYGLNNPEIQISFHPDLLAQYEIPLSAIASTLQSNYQDVSAGTTKIGQQPWLVRWVGKSVDPEYIGNLPIQGLESELRIKDVAKVSRNREKASTMVKFDGHPGIMYSVTKKSETNTILLVEKLIEYIKDKDQDLSSIGLNLTLIDDQTEMTNQALSVMQNNALFGLILVLFSTWLFLGTRISFFVSIGIPFTLAGTFIALKFLGQTLNVSVLLGTVIALGMLVDDSVVVVEAIYARIVQGQSPLTATRDALKEVFAPVTSSVLTTTAAFLPLMFLPGILGKYMMVIPLVVTTALILSLIEAYWMLPSHLIAYAPSQQSLKNSKIQRIRDKYIKKLRNKYIKYQVFIFRNIKKSLASIFIIVILAVFILVKGLIHVDFFASDTLRIFYINIEMPIGASLTDTLEQTYEIEKKAKQILQSNETRSTASYSGLMFTETSPRFGDNYGQIVVSLKPNKDNTLRSVDEIVENIRNEIINTPGPQNISFLKMAGGPPTSKPINIKIRGSDINQIRIANDNLTQFLSSLEGVFDIDDDDSIGRRAIVIKPDQDALRLTKLTALEMSNVIRYLTDGKIIDFVRSKGDKINVRLKSEKDTFNDIDQYLEQSIMTPVGITRLGDITKIEIEYSSNSILHYDFRRAITLTADIHKDSVDTITVNNKVIQYWDSKKHEHPDVDLVFSGELDDIQESLDQMPFLFMVGLAVIYMILGTQFRSYWQPFLVLTTIPMAFLGVIFGLFFTKNPLSLFTLYGIVALSGITVNSSIILISAANQRVKEKMSILHATVYVARRRLIPILITSITTIAGLFSLATGLGGSSMIWGPVATSIVCGLVFSTIFTLTYFPIFYYFFHRKNMAK